ncbi:MAG: hypothetical protein A3K76_06320 [Euryarchaeota archaeon RBG_13_57_23]|nr:MAG: hypothetical protein A3K76_06320 [Euryarchaeota archaeon RBG_13_57_23]
MVLTTIPIGVSAELPHENFELVGSDLEMVIALLNSSIRASENALRQFYEEDVPEANQHLSMASGILTPASQILTEIQGLAGSYENLSSLLPPFLQLQTKLGEWSSQEESLLLMRDDVVTASQLANLTDEDLIAAITAIKTVQSLIISMNRTIDDMLIPADEISALTVDAEHVFVPNELRPLIEQLRELLRLILAEIEALIHDDIPWALDPSGQERAFVLLWLADSRLYLGEPIIGGGYLYYNGSFRSGQSVHILMNSSELMTVTTGPTGAFSFVQQVPINASWLGSHIFVATATTPFVNLTSDAASLSIVLMPTTVRIESDETLLSIDEIATVSGTLVDVYGNPIANGSCRLVMDGSTLGVTTSEDGEFERSWTAQELWFGIHQVKAFYDPELPYEPSESNTVEITVSIPTAMTFRLFSEKFRPGYYIVGNGSLMANESDPLVGQRVTIYIDGVMIQNVTTTASGEFAIAIPVGDLERGTHVIRAAFQFKDDMWRYCEAEDTFIITSLKPGAYPFFPFFPGWEGSPLERFPYLFFGENAYYTWLFLLIVIAILVKAVQVRRAQKKRAKERATLIGGSSIDVFQEDIITGALAEGDKMFDSLLAHSPADPNGRIVWYYNSLITFLTRKRRISITDSMTHWEVAKLLKSLGFPGENVEKVTMLFEQAFYSGSILSDLDSLSMSVAMDGLRGRKAGGGAPAG